MSRELEAKNEIQPAKLAIEDVALGLLYPEPPRMSEDEKIGLIDRLGSRTGISVQKVAIRLVQGWSRSMAVVGSGITNPQLTHLCKNDPESAAILQQLEDVGFATRWEGELYSRAAAGKDDRGSMRALEMLLKARSPIFQEKFAVQHSLMTAAEGARRQATVGWNSGGTGQFGDE